MEPEPITAAEPIAAAEEPRGLGWLLSLSGLGAETPVPGTSPLAPEPVVEEEAVKPAGWFAADADAENETAPETDATEATVVDAEITQTRLTTETAEPEITQTRLTTDTAEPEITQTRLGAEAAEPENTRPPLGADASEAETTQARLGTDAGELVQTGVGEAEITQARLGEDVAEVSDVEVTQPRLTLDSVAEPVAAEVRRGLSRDEDVPGGDVPEWIAAVQAGYGRHERADPDDRPGRHEQASAEPLAAAHLAAEKIAAEPVQVDEPAVETYVPGFPDREPVFEADVPASELEEPVVEDDARAVAASEPVVEVDEPAFAAGEPVVEVAEPVLEAEEPVFTVVTDLAEAVAEDVAPMTFGAVDAPVSIAPVIADEPVGVSAFLDDQPSVDAVPGEPDSGIDFPDEQPSVDAFPDEQPSVSALPDEQPSVNALLGEPDSAVAERDEPTSAVASPDEPVDSWAGFGVGGRPVGGGASEADVLAGPAIPAWPPIDRVATPAVEGEAVAGEAAAVAESEPVIESEPVAVVTTGESELFSTVATPAAEVEPVAASATDAVSATGESELGGAVATPAGGIAPGAPGDEVLENSDRERDGGASADTVSAGAGPASGDAHDTSEPGSTVAHHHDGTGPAFALTDNTATEASAAVPTMVEVPADGGTDSESAAVDHVADLPAVDAAEIAETAGGVGSAAIEAAGVAGATDTETAWTAPAAAAGGVGSAAIEAAGAVGATDTETAWTAPAAEEAGDAPVADVGGDATASGVAESATAGVGAGAVAAADGAHDVPGNGSGSEAEETVAPIRQRRDQRAPADRRRADPEQILAAYPWMFDPETLREQVDEPDRLWDLVDRLSDRLEFAERDAVRAGLLSLRAVVSRVLGELDEALADGREGLRHAESAGDPRMVSVAQTRLAHVLQWRGEFEEADRLYAKADSPELPARLRGEIYELAGRSAFEQGRFLEAVNRFERALDLCQDRDPELVERIELALDVIARRSGDGWGPYPRRREELLELPAAPMPLPDEGAGLWGYAAAVEPKYAQAQAFAEGVAWVRRPDSTAWELIDPSGAVLIGADSGYLAADRFSEGLAWVSREAEGGWSAIDRENRLIVPGSFEEVRPFRRGLALFRRAGGWGAVDRHGRIVVQPKWRQVATVLSVGGPIDGFSDEGFLVVDGGTGFGVIDQTGQQVIPPVHKAVVIHPSAFLIADEAGRWGAVDRQGQPLVETRYVERAEAIEEVVRLRPDARPVL
ncbi:WG repeat-containing protein [Actinoplanes sp. NPDC020271]|uniref:WG repeat-containing protein n=1 Tax=Actinoplanes sp. NPDC020271 TaxID=3363896 RepID=UPI0037958972